MNKDFVKALLIAAAYQGAAAVCEPAGEPGASATGGLPIDPLIQDAGLQNKGVMVYEEALGRPLRSRQHGLKKYVSLFSVLTAPPSTRWAQATLTSSERNCSEKLVSTLHSKGPLCGGDGTCIRT
jgi:hypothetical protein